MHRSFSLADWLDERTGFRAGADHLLNELLPSGTGWWFTLGSVLLLLLTVQLVTGVVLTLYYAPTPDHAYNSVRFMTTEVAFGGVVRALHYFGASFVIVACVLHMLRVLVFGAYKRPREATWMSGVLLLLIILGFGLSGYLLPWDQRAYWATVVTINIAGSIPVIGGAAASLIQGGPSLGALTLSRWYSAHILLLPAALFLFVALHLYLMRRHGIAGPMRPRQGPGLPFYPFHAVKDTVVVALVFAVLLTVAVIGEAPLDHPADPADTTYTPRPEWYFLGLFQLLKYFPGQLEVVAAHGIPGLLVLLLLLLPFLDRGSERHWSRRRGVLGATGVVLLALGTLTGLGLRDVPANQNLHRWGPGALAGRALVRDERCTKCHTPGGIGPDLNTTYLSRHEDWVLGHTSDPEAIAPGLRPQPEGGFALMERQAVVSYLRKMRVGAAPPVSTPQDEHVAKTLALNCLSCHAIDSDGGTSGPDLSRIGADRSVDWLVQWISNPRLVKSDTTMPAFGRRLTAGELRAVAEYLGARR